MQKFKKGFTLVEMMIVLAIIAVVAGGVIYTIGDIGGGVKLQRVDGDIQAIEVALTTYKLLGGKYPTTAQGLNALVSKPTIPPHPRRYKAKLLKKVPEDPWGNSYLYKIPGEKNAATYEIISFGPDGKKGGGDDLSSQD